MSFNSEIELPSSSRYMLVRMTPARHVSTQLISEGSSIYGMTFSSAISRVERNGVLLTETSTSPPSSNDEWCHDEDTNSLKIKLASAPSETTNVIVVYYHLFFTDGAGCVTNEDPDNTSTPRRIWSPRLSDAPKIRQSVENALSGVFTIQSTSLSLLNSDQALQEYLTSDDSFYDQDVAIWIAVNGITNVSRVFTGKSRDIRLTKELLSVEIYDAFSRMDQPAYMGDSADEAIFQTTASSFPDMHPQKAGTPCPMILGSKSRSIFVRGGTLTATPPTAYEQADPQSQNEAVCVNFNPELSLTANRVWGLCRVPSQGLVTQVIGSVEAKSTGTTTWHVRFSSHNLQKHMTVKWTYFGNPYWGIVLDASTHVHGGVTYNCYIQMFSEEAPYTGNITTDANTVFIPLVGVTIWHVASDDANGVSHPAFVGRPLRQEGDYTISQTATSGGNKYLEITMADSWEQGDFWIVGSPTDGRINPDIDRVHYQVWLDEDTELTHGNVLQRLCETVGLTVDSSTFDVADAALAANCMTQIPFHDENKYHSYQYYAENILKSTLGYLIANADGEAEYHLLEEVASSSERDHSSILRNSMTIRIQYSDLVTQVLASNIHDPYNALATVSTDENARARWLYGIVRPLTLEHVLDDITGRIDAHLAFRSRPLIIYKFSTSATDLNTRINDDLTVVSSVAIGEDGSHDTKVISIELGTDNSEIETIVVEGL